MTQVLVEHFFRHEYGRLVAVLSNRVGLEHLAAVEDAVQSAMEKGLDYWVRQGPPDNPTAWIYRVASNLLLDSFRADARHTTLLERYAPELVTSSEEIPECLMPQEISDQLLRMLFVCCHEDLPKESQLVFALKTLCGFSIGEIAHRLFATEQAIYKRLQRAHGQIKGLSKAFLEPSVSVYKARLPWVHNILYTLFTEGHFSSREDSAIRRDLCDEAIRLAALLVDHEVGQTPETNALLALMHLNLARLGGRLDGSGGLLLLEEQDRSRWDQHRIQYGLAWLAKSATGERFSRYHAEAGIAAEHCLAETWKDTRWNKVVGYYDLLEQHAPSPIHQMNRAVAVAEWQGPERGLELINNLSPPHWLAKSYLWLAVQSDLNRRCGNQKLARELGSKAIAATPNSIIRAVLEKRLRTGASTREC